MPILITETIVKQRPLAFILLKFQAEEACLSIICLRAIFSVVNTYAIQDTCLFHILTTLENRYGFWPQTGCVTVPGREAAFLVVQQQFPYHS